MTPRGRGASRSVLPGAERMFLIILYVIMYSSGISLKTKWSEGLRTKGPPRPASLCSLFLGWITIGRGLKMGKEQVTATASSAPGGRAQAAASVHLGGHPDPSGRWTGPLNKAASAGLSRTRAPAPPSGGNTRKTFPLPKPGACAASASCFCARASVRFHRHCPSGTSALRVRNRIDTSAFSETQDTSEGDSLFIDPRTPR